MYRMNSASPRDVLYRQRLAEFLLDELQAATQPGRVAAVRVACCCADATAQFPHRAFTVDGGERPHDQRAIQPQKQHRNVGRQQAEFQDPDLSGIERGGGNLEAQETCSGRTDRVAMRKSRRMKPSVERSVARITATCAFMIIAGEQQREVGLCVLVYRQATATRVHYLG